MFRCHLRCVVTRALESPGTACPEAFDADGMRGRSAEADPGVVREKQNLTLFFPQAWTRQSSELIEQPHSSPSPRDHLVEGGWECYSLNVDKVLREEKSYFA